MRAHLSRRTALRAIGSTFIVSLVPNFPISAQVETSPVVTVDKKVELPRGVVINHFRVVDLGPSSPDHSAVIGSLTNTSQEAIDAPYGIEIVLHDIGEVIIGSAYLGTDYPVLPPNEPMGFGSFLIDVPFSEIDPEQTTFDTESILTNWSTGARARLRERTIEVVSTTELSRAGSLAVECELTNTSAVDFDNGLLPKISVWDSDGLYCGYAFDNVFQRIPAGQTIRFETQSNGSVPNPVKIADPGFTWKAWFDPR